MNEDDRNIYNLAKEFRTYIEWARDGGVFPTKCWFTEFPKRCCGDASYLLAEYFRTQGIETIYVWGDYGGQSHGWLVLNDDRIKKPKQETLEVPDEIKSVLSLYGGKKYSEPIDVTHYKENDLDEGLIIDITADQFGEAPVYVGYIDDFHRKFCFEFAHDYDELGNTCLVELYRKITAVIIVD